MKSRLVKIIVATVIGGIVGLACSGIATASAAEHHKATTHTAAAQLQKLHDQLEAAMRGKDVESVRDSVDALRPVFTQLKAAPIARSAQEMTFRADNIAARAQRGLLPGLPDPLAIVTDLLQTLLSTVMDLVTGLLGGLPVPLPDLPGLPLPLPGLPGGEPGGEPGGLPLPLPLPDLPGLPGGEPPADAPAPGGEPAPAPGGQPAPAPGGEPAPEEPAAPGLPGLPALPLP